MLGSETINRITIEETLKVKPKKKDNKEEREFRRQVKKDIAKIKKSGMLVHIPAD